MGNFFGHVIPGSFFLLFGVWYLIQVIRRFHRSRNRNTKGQFRSTPYYSVTICRRTIQLDAWISVIFCVIGIGIELNSTIYSATHYHNYTVMAADLQHTTMYTFFMLCGLTSIIVPKLPPFLDSDVIVYIAQFLAAIAEGLLFTFHVAGQKGQELTLHLFLIFTIFSTAVVLLFEMTHRESVFFALARAYMLTLQGTWFIQVAFIAFPPLTDPGGHLPPPKLSQYELHGRVMFLACVFCWHLAGNFIVFLVSCWLSLCCGRREKLLPQQQGIPEQPDDEESLETSAEDVQLLVEFQKS